MSSCLIAETFQDALSERSSAKSQQGPVLGLMALHVQIAAESAFPWVLGIDSGQRQG